MSSCCASVGFVFWEGSPSRARSCVCECLCVCTLARLLPGGEGRCVWVCGASVGLKRWKTATEQSTSRSPGRHWSLGNPSNERGWDSCSLLFRESGWSPNAYIIALLVWHGVWGFLFFFFWKVWKGAVPHPMAIWNPLCFSPAPPPWPPSSHPLPPEPPSLLPLPTLCVWALHSGSCNIPVFELSPTLAPSTRPPGSPSRSRSAHVPSAAPFLHENLVFGMFFDSWGGVPRLIILSVE